MDTRVSLNRRTAPGMFTPGTHSTTSHHLWRPSWGLMASANALASVRVLFIFQLPAMMVLRYLRFICGTPFFYLKKCVYASSRQATPGSSLPSMNSREAPPPVEIWVILSA